MNIYARKAADAVIGLAIFALAACGANAQPSSGRAPSSNGSQKDVGAASPAEHSGQQVEDGRLMFSRFDESDHNFLGTFIAETDGSEARQVDLPGPEGGGRFSHAGDEIAVMTLLDDGRVGTAVIAADGTVLRVLTIQHPTLNLLCDVWSPDDERLACEGFDDAHPGLRGLYTVSARDGRGLKRLTTTPTGKADIPGDYSPDGATVIFNRQPRENERGILMTVPATGGSARPFAPGVTDLEDPGRFSPDGRFVLTSGDGALFIFDRSGTLVDRITEQQHYLFGAVWSPTGKHIAYSSSGGNSKADVFVALADGSQRHQVTETSYNEIGVDWGP